MAFKASRSSSARDRRTGLLLTLLAICAISFACGGGGDGDSGCTPEEAEASQARCDACFDAGGTLDSCATSCTCF